MAAIRWDVKPHPGKHRRLREGQKPAPLQNMGVEAAPAAEGSRRVLN